MMLFRKFLTSIDSGCFSCIRTQSLGTYLSTELQSLRTLLKLSVLSFLQPSTAVVLSRGACWTLKASMGDRVSCCVGLMHLDVQTCHLLCDTLHLLHSMHLRQNYPWKIQKCDAFLAEDDDAAPDTVGVKYSNKLVKEALCLLKIWLESQSLQCCDSSWVLYQTLYSLYICTWIIVVSASWLLLIFSTSCRELETFQCLPPNSNTFNLPLTWTDCISGVYLLSADILSNLSRSY